MDPILVGCQVLACADSAGCCLVGPSHEVAGCGMLGGLGASAGSLVSRIRVSKILGLLLIHWQVKTDPAVSVPLQARRAGSWSLATGPRDPRAHFRSLGGRGGIPGIVGYGVRCVQKVELTY